MDFQETRSCTGTGSKSELAPRTLPPWHDLAGLWPQPPEGRDYQYGYAVLLSLYKPFFTEGYQAGTMATDSDWLADAPPFARAVCIKPDSNEQSWKGFLEDTGETAGTEIINQDPFPVTIWLWTRLTERVNRDSGQKMLCSPFLIAAAVPLKQVFRDDILLHWHFDFLSNTLQTSFVDCKVILENVYIAEFYSHNIV